MDNIFSEWAKKVYSGKRGLDCKKLYKITSNQKSIDSNKQKSYFLLKALLEIRLQYFSQASRSIESLRGLMQGDTGFIYFLRSLIECSTGDVDLAMKSLDRAIDLDPSSICCMELKAFLLSQSSDKNLYKLFVKELCDNNACNAFSTVLELDFNLLHGINISESIMLFASRVELNSFAEHVERPAFLEWSEYGSISEIFEVYRRSCKDCLLQIERIFDFNISKDFEYAQAECTLHRLKSIVGEEFSRARPFILGNPKFDNNKGLQMLCSPGYWMLSQNQLFAFICAEIQFIRSTQGSDGEIVLHEIGPGCGYMMKLFSSLKNVSVTGSDCYDINSFDVTKLEDNGGNSFNFDASSCMEMLTYFLSNQELGNLESISNSPVGIDSFSIEMMSSDIVYSHLPVIDQCDPENIWGSSEWMSFFENVFISPISKVKYIVISRNAHSEGLRSDHSKTLSSNIFDVKIYDNFCTGNVVVVRRK